MEPYEALIAEVQDILPELTLRQVIELQGYVDEGDYDSARMLLLWISKTARHLHD